MFRLTGGHWSGSELVLLGSEWTNKGGVKASLRCGDNAESLCLPFSPLCSSRPMWSRAPPWRLISAIRRSLLKPRGMFQTTAGAMHSGVASPWTPDLDQLSTLAQVRHSYTEPSRLSHIYPVFLLFMLHVHTPAVSPHLHVPSVFLSGLLFLWSLSHFSGDLSHFVSALRQFGKGNTVLLYAAPQTESLHETERPNRDRFSLMSPAGLCKRTLSTWPKRWHFLNVKIPLQGSCA